MGSGGTGVDVVCVGVGVRCVWRESEVDLFDNKTKETRRRLIVERFLYGK